MSEAYFVRQRKNNNFTIVNNAIFNDSRLSAKAKGVLVQLLSLPNDWKIYISELVSHFADGKDAIYSAIRELKKFGYIKETQERTEKGCFGATKYIIFENPEEGSSLDVSPLRENPHTENPNTAKPDMDFPPLLTTNNTKNLKKLTTNLHSGKKAKKEVSESVFQKTIKNIFGGDYLFDDMFESEVLAKLNEKQLPNDAIGEFLQYVFERTKNANPKKSFEGLYHKLALSASILRDFSLLKKSEKNTEISPIKCKVNSILCPICNKKFDVFLGCCPDCSLSVVAIRNNDKQEIAIHSAIYGMNEEQTSEYNKAYACLAKSKNRSFLTPEEKVALLKEQGFLPQNIGENND